MNVTRILSAGLAALAFLAVGTTAQAAPIIDQSNPAAGGFIGGYCLAFTAQCGQSFQQSADNIAGASIFVDPAWNFNNSAALTISIYANLSNPLSLIASGTANNVTKNSGWVDVFWSAVALTPNTTYYMNVTATSVVSLQGTGNLYARGMAFSAGTGTPSIDLVFRTYSDVVPAPGAFSLLLAGLAGLVATRRRKAIVA